MPSTGQFWRNVGPPSEFFSVCRTQLLLRGLVAEWSEVNEEYLHHYDRRYFERCGSKKVSEEFQKSCFFVVFCPLSRGITLGEVDFVKQGPWAELLL